jgi:hypothetical protein
MWLLDIDVMAGLLIVYLLSLDYLLASRQHQTCIAANAAYVLRDCSNVSEVHAFYAYNVVDAL